MEPIGEGKALGNPSVPHKKMVLEAAESREYRLCCFMPGHSGGGGCHLALGWGGHSLAIPLLRAAAWREKWSLGWWEFSGHTEDRGTKGIHNRKAPWRRGQFLTRSDVISEKELNYKTDSPGGGKEEGRVGTWRDSSLVMSFVLAEDAG